MKHYVCCRRQLLTRNGQKNKNILHIFSDLFSDRKRHGQISALKKYVNTRTFSSHDIVTVQGQPVNQSTETRIYRSCVPLQILAFSPHLFSELNSVMHIQARGHACTHARTHARTHAHKHARAHTHTHTLTYTAQTDREDVTHPIHGQVYPEGVVQLVQQFDKFLFLKMQHTRS